MEENKFNKVISDFYDVNEYLSHIVNVIKDAKANNLSDIDKDRLYFHSTIAQRKLIEIKDLLFDE